MATKPAMSMDNDVIDIDLSVIKKKKFRINGDNNKILELNVSDMGIVARLGEAYPKLEALQKKVGDFADTASEADIAKKLEEIDSEMRELIDFIFDSNVSEICASDGSMYDPINGMFRYEHIMDTLTTLYESNLNAEFKKMKARVNKYAKKK